MEESGGNTCAETRRRSVLAARQETDLIRPGHYAVDQQRIRPTSETAYNRHPV